MHNVRWYFENEVLWWCITLYPTLLLVVDTWLRYARREVMLEIKKHLHARLSLISSCYLDRVKNFASSRQSESMLCHLQNQFTTQLQWVTWQCKQAAVRSLKVQELLGQNESAIKFSEITGQVTALKIKISLQSLLNTSNFNYSERVQHK